MEIVKKITQIAQQNPLLSKLLKRKGTPSEAPSICLVCDYGKSKIIFLEIEKSTQGIKILKYHKATRNAPSGKEAEVLKDLFTQGGYSTSKVRISVKGQGVIIRFVQFPQMKEADLRSAISFEIDQYIPFKAHEVVWDFYVLEDNIPLGQGTGMNILLIAMKREDLYATIQVFQSAGMEVELVDVDALASVNALEYFEPEDFKSAVAILDIGTEVSTLSVVQNGKPRFIRDITFGGVDILKRLRRKLGITQEQALTQIEVDCAPSPEAAAVIKEALGDLFSDLRVSLNYYLDQLQGAEAVKKIFIQGGGGYHPLIIETLSQSFGFPAVMMNLMAKAQLAEGLSKELIQKNQGTLPVALGVCLR